MKESVFKTIQNYYSDNEIRLIPYEKIEITSSLKTDEIKSRLGSKIEWTEIFGMAFHKKSFKEYEGWIRNNEFKFRRILKSGTNSFIPIFSGEIKCENQNSKIEVDIKFPRFINVLLICFISFGLLLLLSGLSLFSLQNNDIFINSEVDIENLREQLGEDKYNEIFEKKEKNINISFQLLFIILPYLVSVISFNIESKKVKADLRAILNAKNENGIE